MDITLNHTIVPSHDNVASAKFYEHVFGFNFIKEWGHFAVVKVNASLTLDFQTKDEFSSIHYAFKVTDDQFDSILNRLIKSDIGYGSEPYSVDNGEINNNHNGRGLYFSDPNGHVLEIITTDYNIDTPIS